MQYLEKIFEKHGGLITFTLCLLMARIWHLGLGGNEEMYLMEALKLAFPTMVSPFSSTIAASWANAFVDIPWGYGAAWLGQESFMLAVRIAVTVGLVAGLMFVASGAGFSRLVVPLAMAVFVLIRQNLLAGEWIFGGFEAKACAYVALLFALGFYLRGRYGWNVLLMAVATYCHFQVGLYWMAMLGVVMLWERPVALWRIVLYGVGYGVLVLPEFALIAYEQMQVQGPVLPNLDWVYSAWRHPHHTSPFVGWEVWRAHFMVGTLLLPVVGVFVFLRLRQLQELPAAKATLVRLAAMALAWVLLAYGLSYLDRMHHTFGKFYLFRPNSLLLFIVLLLALEPVVRSLKKRHPVRATAGLLGGCIFVALLCLANDVKLTKWALQNQNMDAVAVAQVQANFVPGSVVAVGDALPLGVTRKLEQAGYPGYVRKQLVPTLPDEITLWYGRWQAVEALGKGDCTAAPEVTGMVLPGKAPAPACMVEVARGKGLAVYRRAQPAS